MERGVIRRLLMAGCRFMAAGVWLLIALLCAMCFDDILLSKAGRK